MCHFLLWLSGRHRKCSHALLTDCSHTSVVIIALLVGWHRQHNYNSNLPTRLSCASLLCTVPRDLGVTCVGCSENIFVKLSNSQTLKLCFLVARTSFWNTTVKMATAMRMRSLIWWTWDRLGVLSVWASGTLRLSWGGFMPPPNPTPQVSSLQPVILQTVSLIFFFFLVVGLQNPE